MNKIDKIIEQRTKQHNRKFNKIIKLIEKYEKIVIFRHSKPDYDAIGSQMALYHWVKDNFPSKEVHFVGDDHVKRTPGCFPYMEVLEESWYKNNIFLALIVDTSTKKRISIEYFKYADYIVKIDHHPQTKKYGKLQVIDEQMCAAGELVANMLLVFSKKDYIISKDCAKYLYIAIVGDSNRFLYNTTTDHTFSIAQYLISLGIDIRAIYRSMYIKDMDDLKAMSYILNNLHITKSGIGYYILSKDELEQLNLRSEVAKSYVNLMDHVDGILIWMSISEIDDGKYKVSIRSSGTKINDIAEKYCGGGHAQASGATLKSISQLPDLIADLESVIK